MVSATNATPQKLRSQKRSEEGLALARSILDAFDYNDDNNNNADKKRNDDADNDNDDAAAKTASIRAKVRRLIQLGKREPFFGGFLNGLTSGLQTLATNTAGALGEWKEWGEGVEGGLRMILQ